MGTVQSSGETNPEPEEKSGESTDFNEFWANFRKSNVSKTASQEQLKSIEIKTPPSSPKLSPTSTSPRFFRKQPDGSLSKSFVLLNGEWLEESPLPPPPPPQQTRASPTFFQKQVDGRLTKHLLLENGQWLNSDDMDTLRKQTSIGEVETKIMQEKARGRSVSKPAKSRSRSRPSSSEDGSRSRIGGVLRSHQSSVSTISLEDVFSSQELDNSIPYDSFTSPSSNDKSIAMTINSKNPSEESEVNAEFAGGGGGGVSSKTTMRGVSSMMENHHHIDAMSLSVVEKSSSKSTVPQFKPQPNVDKSDKTDVVKTNANLIEPSLPSKSVSPSKKNKNHLRVTTSTSKSTVAAMSSSSRNGSPRRAVCSSPTSAKSSNSGSPRSSSPRLSKKGFKDMKPSPKPGGGLNKKKSSSSSFTAGGVSSPPPVPNTPPPPPSLPSSSISTLSSSPSDISQVSEVNSPKSPLMIRKEKHLARLKEKEKEMGIVSNTEKDGNSSSSEAMIKRNSAPSSMITGVEMVEEYVEGDTSLSRAVLESHGSLI